MSGSEHDVPGEPPAPPRVSSCEIVPRVEDLPDGARADVFVVVDVLRFSTTAAVALAGGARGVRPCADADEARAFGREVDDAVLIGERDGERLPGFDLDNSPTAVEDADLSGRAVAIVTTNGTRTISRIREVRSGGRREPRAGGDPEARALARIREERAGGDPEPRPRSDRRHGGVWVGSTVNAGAVAAALRRHGGDVCIVAAGRSGRVADDDVAAAELIRELTEGREPGEGAAERYRTRIRRSAWARRLVRLGRADDVERALRFDSLDVVPVLGPDGVLVPAREL